MTRPVDRPTTTRQLIDRLLGVSTDSRDDPLITSASTTVQQVLLANPSRVAFTFVNLGTNAVFLWSDEAVSTSRGIRVGPNGGAAVFNYEQDLSKVTKPWFVVSASGTPSISTTEELIQS